MRGMCCVVLLAGGMAVAQAAEIYRWTDEHGRVHFGQRPQAGAEQVEVKPQVVERDDATREREANVERFYEARRQEQRESARQQAERQAQRAEECGALRERLAEVSKDGRYYRVDDAGRHIYYSDAEITAARRQLTERIGQRCG
ncbi:DUF4124 domain-containing protein [Zestomonas carbonaria]|uniref:DUF4124 domain-containing protein n=1 Tax=Zestomonas carbonaria TaxID=2762745 RepID=A0A7U7I795_9GAMM|nr:DUF4124 domain-containing protein [Pseudomonas carbonaria]CAD5105985.1 hypothetical protein PSEWESI4_00244 [Pseudomonas carbonaria]